MPTTQWCPPPPQQQGDTTHKGTHTHQAPHSLFHLESLESKNITQATGSALSGILPSADTCGQLDDQEEIRSKV